MQLSPLTRIGKGPAPARKTDTITPDFKPTMRQRVVLTDFASTLLDLWTEMGVPVNTTTIRRVHTAPKRLGVHPTTHLDR